MSLEIVTSDLLAPLRHGFFTRVGGASSGVFRGLNCGPGSTDQQDVVRLNRTIAASALGVAGDRLVTLHQTHSADVLAISAPEDALDDRGARRQADAMVSATPGLALAVLTADCQPVLLADRAAGVIGAAHAGWKGALAGVLEATVAEMEGLGARRADITAVIGPSIGPTAYEVGPELRARFVAADPAHALFFVSGEGDRFLFDLPGFGLRQLERAGVGAAQWTGLCTYSEPDRFYSYRRSVHAGEPDYGRLLSAIVL
ncbi:MAG: peptidoglycan editing factor PgeF [Rhodobacteraceae bacterium]|nr:peptidoglycan editing factor PgeF [Paracoccaceae bacterium]